MPERYCKTQGIDIDTRVTELKSRELTKDTRVLTGGSIPPSVRLNHEKKGQMKRERKITPDQWLIKEAKKKKLKK